MDSWALREAVATVAAWRAWVPELAGLTVAVNVCLSSIDEAQWANKVLDVLLKYGLPTSALTLEVSERSAGNASPVALAALRTLVEAGCQVAIDDIGTGTSTLARLVDLPVTQLKIDQRFVGSMATDPRAEAVTRTLAHLGKTMGLDVVAEGVEDAPTAELALKSGCTSGQGYYWSHPKWEEELVLALLLDKHLTAHHQA